MNNKVHFNTFLYRFTKYIIAEVYCLIMITNMKLYDANKFTLML